MGDKNKDTARGLGQGYGKTTCSFRRGCAKGVGIRGRGQLGISPQKRYLGHRKLSVKVQGCTEHAAAELSNTGSEALLARVQGRRMGINKKRSGIKPAQLQPSSAERQESVELTEPAHTKLHGKQEGRRERGAAITCRGRGKQGWEIWDRNHSQNCAGESQHHWNGLKS